MMIFTMEYSLITVAIFLGILEYTNGIFGPNVCTEKQNYTLTTRVKYQQPVSVKTYSWCFDIPPKCSSVHTEMREKWKVLTEQRTMTVDVCCVGFKELESRCIPKCPDGFAGDNCDEECPLDKWGPSCSKECRCPSNSICDATNGKCICIDGWVGPRCSIPRQAVTNSPHPSYKETKSHFDWSTPVQVPIFIPKHDKTTAIIQVLTDKSTRINESTPMYINNSKNSSQYIVQSNINEVTNTISTTSLKPLNTENNISTFMFTNIPFTNISDSSTIKAHIPIVLTEDIFVELANNATEPTTTEVPATKHYVKTTTDSIQDKYNDSVIIATTTLSRSPILETDLVSQIESPEITVTTTVTDSPITVILHNMPKAPTKVVTKPTESSIISLTVLKSTASTARRKPINSTLTNVSAKPKGKVYTESRMITIPVKIVFDSGHGFPITYKKNYTKFSNVSRISAATSENGRLSKKLQHDGIVRPMLNATMPSMVTTETEETKHVLTEPEQITSVAGNEDSDDNKDDLYSTLSIAMGVATAIILMAAIIVLVARYRRGRNERNKKMERDHVQAMMNATEDEVPSTYLRSVFHSPLPETPPTSTLQYPNTSASGKSSYQIPFMQPVVIHTVSPIMMENFRGILECHYDHPKPPRPTSFSPVSRTSTFSLPPSSFTNMNTLPKPRDNNSVYANKADVSFPVTDAAINTLKLECQNNVHAVEIENTDPVYDEIPCWSTSVSASEMIIIEDEAVTEL